MKHTAINFGPRATNILDWQYKDGLYTKNGLQPVRITRDGNNFAIKMGDKTLIVSDDNLQISYMLNTLEVGTIQ